MRLPFWQTMLHAGFCVFLILYIFTLKRYFKKKVYEFDSENITPSDFTVWVKDLDSNYRPEQLKEFYEKRGLGKNSNLEVSCISPVYDIKTYVEKVRTLERCKGDLSYLEDYIKKYGKYPSSPCCSKTNYSKTYLNTQIRTIESWLNSFETTNKNIFSQSNSVFVTFRRQSVAKKVLKFWNRSIFDIIVLFICSKYRL